MSADGKVLIDTELNTKPAEKSAKGLGGSLKSGLAKGAKVATGAMVAIGTATTATAGAMVKAYSHVVYDIPSTNSWKFVPFLFCFNELSIKKL